MCHVLNTNQVWGWEDKQRLNQPSCSYVKGRQSKGNCYLTELIISVVLWFFIEVGRKKKKKTFFTTLNVNILKIIILPLSEVNPKPQSDYCIYPKRCLGSINPFGKCHSWLHLTPSLPQTGCDVNERLIASLQPPCRERISLLNSDWTRHGPEGNKNTLKVFKNLLMLAQCSHTRDNIYFGLWPDDNVIASFGQSRPFIRDKCFPRMHNFLKNTCRLHACI